jgi:hypothetical protein
MATGNFQAIVVKPSTRGLTHAGKQLSIGVWIDPGAKAEQFSVTLYEALQDAYNGALEISHKRGRAFIELTKTFCSRESVTTEARTLSDRITRHLGICATVQ